MDFVNPKSSQTYLEKIQREQLIHQLQEEVTASYDTLRAGKGFAIEEARNAVI